MMNDQELEGRLRAYRPAGPPDSLRPRVVAGSGAVPAGRTPACRASGRVLAWLPAVAAMLLAAAFYWLAASGRERIFAQLPPPGAARAIDVNLETPQ